jgi:V/A-type H+-transporting ATPase subunit I
MLLSMAKVQIIGTKRCQDKTVQLLHRLGTVQIDEWSEGRSLSQQRLVIRDEAVHLRERLAYMTTRVEVVLSALPPLELPPPLEYENYYTRPLDWLLYAVETDLEEVGPQAQTLVTRRDQLEEQLGSLPRYEATLRQLLPLMPAIMDLEQFSVIAVWVERRYQAVLETITRQLTELTEGMCEVMSRKVDQDILAAVLVFPKTQVEPVNKLLGQENITQVRLPTEFTGQPFEKALTNIRQRLQAIPRELAEIEAQQQALAHTWRPRLLTWQALLRDHLAQVDVCTHFGQTDYTFIIEGWVPRRRLAEMEVVLAREVGDEVLVAELSLGAEEEKLAPVMFDNPAFVKPFEPLIGLLALPKYGDFDPTPLMFLFFPLFFGMILGDVAYGAILLALMIYLRQRFKARPTMRSLAEVMIMGSAWSIVFGFMYGEVFGTLGEALGLHPLWFDRGHEVQALFLMTIGIGAGHIVLGLCLGVWLALRRRSHHEVIEKAATLISLAALFLLVAVLADYLPDFFFTPAIALLVVGLAILIYSLGGIGVLLGPLELVGTVGNILSYLRIAAIGLSSIYLAQVANELAGIAGNLLLGIIIAGLFHALNIVLGAFSPTIQSLRLHYVEFFSKFYEGGGQPFRPFQRSIGHP